MPSVEENEHPASVGIYWLTPDHAHILIASRTPVTDGLAYGDWLISPDGHYEFWRKHSKIQPLSNYPKSIRNDYAALPRGRVSYHVPTSMYVVYHGNWLKPIHKALLNAYFHLPHSATRYEYDEHYTI
jgi:hypothetical protein